MFFIFIISIFRELQIMERHQVTMEEQILNPQSSLEPALKTINFVVFYAAETEYIKYECGLDETIDIKDSFIYQVCYRVP